MSSETTPKKLSFIRKMWPFFLGGAVGGYAISTVSDRLITVLDMGLSAGIASAVASIYVLLGAMVVLMGLVRRLGETGLEIEEGEEFEQERPKLLYNGVAALTWGLALYCLVFAEPLGPLSPVLSFALFAVFMALGCLAYLPMHRRLDEFDRALSLEASSLTYYLVLAFGGGWAALAHVGIVGGPELLDWLSMFWGLMLLATFAVAWRRGVLK